MPKVPKRPRDPNQLAKAIVDIATGAAPDTVPLSSPAKEFARKGGLKGGVARAAKLTADQRRDIARRAAEVRWANKSDDDD
jgi:hypothetical protein